MRASRTSSRPSSGPRSVDSAWFAEPGTGEEHLLFRIVDAKEVWRSFDELSRETDAACGRAAAELAKRDARAAARPRDGRPLSRPRRAGEVGVGGDRGSARHHPRQGAGAPPAEGEGEMSPARVAVAAALSVAAFLAANSYAACLLSLPGSPAANLAEALRLLPSFPRRPRPPLARGCRARDGARGRERGVVRVGVVAHARARAAPGRGARQRALGKRARGQALHEPGGPRPEHPAHRALRDGHEPPRPRPPLRAQPATCWSSGAPAPARPAGSSSPTSCK